MKKFISLLLLTAVIFAGCSKTPTEKSKTQDGTQVLTGTWVPERGGPKLTFFKDGALLVNNRPFVIDGGAPCTWHLTGNILEISDNTGVRNRTALGLTPDGRLIVSAFGMAVVYRKVSDGMTVAVR